MARRSKSIEVKSHRQIKNPKAGSNKTHPIKDRALRMSFIGWFSERYENARTEKKRIIYDRDRMIILTALYTAFRAEDLLQLQVFQVVKGKVDIKENKTGKHQFFTLPTEYVMEINSYIRRNQLQENDYLFKSSKAGVIEAVTRQRIDRVINQAVKETRIPFVVGMHGLRKTFGYCCVAEWGYSTEDVRIFLNHSSSATTEHYIEWSYDDIDKMRSQISYFRK